MLSIFPTLEIKRLVLVGKIFDDVGNVCSILHNIAYMVNSIIVSLDIPVMINILYENIKMLHEKILTAIDLY